MTYPALVQALQQCRAAEKEQALFYRALAAAAEEQGIADLSERFHALHADEQHHLSRLTARLLELGAAPADLPRPLPRAVPLERWKGEVVRREQQEVNRYELLLEQPLDLRTRALIGDILDAEHHHAAELGGKWMLA